MAKPPSSQPYADFQTLAITVHDGLHTLTLNRPERLNAINMQMAMELREYFTRLAEDASARVVILKGAGRHFCAGLDLTDTSAVGAGSAGGMRTQRAYSEFIVRMRRCPQPIIAQVHGAASGGGFALMLAADVRYAAEDARMNVAMARIGLSGCDMGISYFLPRAAGTSNAAELMMGGRFVDARRAQQIGIVSALAPRERLDELGQAMAAEMLAMSPLGLRLTKEGMNASLESGSLEAVIAVEDRGQVMCLGPYLKEGAAAFLEKRPPRWVDE